MEATAARASSRTIRTASAFFRPWRRPVPKPTGRSMPIARLMKTHFHLVVEAPRANLVTGMKWLLSTYTIRFDRWHKVFAHLFTTITMIAHRVTRVAAVLALAVQFSACAAAEELPGLTFLETKEKLTGCLAFLFSDDPSGYWTNSLRTSIYEFDLQQRKLRKITSAPAGIFLASDDGKIFCVAYGQDPVSHEIGTNVFIFDGETRQGRTVPLGRAPRAFAIVAATFSSG